MWSILALGIAQRCINTAIDLDAISRVQLNALQGKMLRVVIASPQLSVDVYFDQDQLRFESTPTGQATTSSIFEQRPFDQVEQTLEATATLQVDNLVSLLKLLFADDVGNIPLQGDYRLLQSLQNIMQQAEPDLASHLGAWLSPSLAHELAKLQQAPKQLKRSVQNQWFFAQDFIKEDSGLFASRWQMQDLQREMRRLQQNLDRAEAKLQQLDAQLNPQSGN